MMRRSVLTGCGHYLPERVVSNEELAQRVDTSDAWISERTGIKSRHIAAENETTGDMAEAAARAALAHGGVDAETVDLVLVATSTPDRTMPSTACRVQGKLGITQGAAFDIQAVCSGFIYALSVADNMLRLGQATRALVIGAEVMSRLLDWDDRTTCVLFGDGAGAVVLDAQEQEDVYSEYAGDMRGVLHTSLYANGKYRELIQTNGGISTTGTAGIFEMQGREVFRHAVDKMAQCVEQGLSTLGLAMENVDWLVPHQANRRILEATAKRLEIPVEKVLITVDTHANTSAASIPLALSHGIGKGQILPGQLLVLEALGAGLTWGTAVIRV